MSGRELQRIEVLSEVLARRRSEISAAAILGLSTRQTRRLLAAYRDGGGGALITRRKARLQALVAVARKLLHAIYGMFRSGLKYEGTKLFPHISAR